MSPTLGTRPTLPPPDMTIPKRAVVSIPSGSGKSGHLWTHPDTQRHRILLAGRRSSDGAQRGLGSARDRRRKLASWEQRGASDDKQQARVPVSKRPPSMMNNPRNSLRRAGRGKTRPLSACLPRQHGRILAGAGKCWRHWQCWQGWQGWARMAVRNRSAGSPLVALVTDPGRDIRTVRRFP